MFSIISINIRKTLTHFKTSSFKLKIAYWYFIFQITVGIIHCFCIFKKGLLAHTTISVLVIEHWKWTAWQKRRISQTLRNMKNPKVTILKTVNIWALHWCPQNMNYRQVAYTLRQGKQKPQNFKEICSDKYTINKTWKYWHNTEVMERKAMYI